MTRLLKLLAAGALVSGCSQDNAAAALRALEPASAAAFLCLMPDGTGNFARPASRLECPQYVNLIGTDEERRHHALVTQPRTGEVALVDLALERAIDYEPTQPAFSFMPVGGEPDLVVSTPGGAASFVTVREPGAEGIFALPTTCIGPRPDDAPLRDIRTWPACRLPVEPGPFILLEDPAVDHDGDPATAPLVRTSCDAEYTPAPDLVGLSPAAQRATCPADLAAEGGAPGRRKLAVALPSLSELWILDAQELLDRAPGSFDACVPERRVALSADVPALTQRLPEDLASSGASCDPAGFNHGPVPTDWRPRPSDFALSDDGRLFVADSEVPKVHVLDVNDPCFVSALPPLRPLSYSDPNAQITTRRVAVSPLTASGKRYLYAVDDSGTSTAGSLMAFDVSASSVERTPIVRPRAAYNPDELPDRISGARNVTDVEFVYQDVTEDGGAAAGPRAEGVFCDPDPRSPADSPGARYRPADDLRSGARPTQFRGTFAYAALHSGQVMVIDVEDLDAPCRRPATVNPDRSVEDLNGCRGDDPTLFPIGYRGEGTVSGELSCNVVAPHRNRSRNFFSNAIGQPVAGLVAFPTLTLATGRSAATDQSPDGREQPKMLGARHSADLTQSEQLYIGPLIYETGNPNSNLELDPALADRSSLLLSFEEPRAFAPEEFVATYEGAVRAPALARFSVDAATGLGLVDEGLNASFCAAGVRDFDLTREVAAELGVTEPDAQLGFARQHADYVQIVGPLLEEDDPHWAPGGAGATCGAALFDSGAQASASQTGRQLCEVFFGSRTVPEAGRDLRIVNASEDQLLVEPRSFDPARNSLERRRELLDFVACCFPEPTAFVIRAAKQWVVDGSVSGIRHHVTADAATGRCINDCSPVRARLNSRVFEISCSDACPGAPDAPAIGRAISGQDFACIVDDGASGGILPGEQGSECVFQSLTTRFAIYRGQSASERGMRFRWALSGGFVPMSIQLLNSERLRSMPHSLELVPELGLMFLTDGSAPGLSLVQPRSLAIVSTID